MHAMTGNARIPNWNRAMSHFIQSSARRLVHTTAALAVLPALYLIHGHLPDRQAGVRTAFELIDKRVIAHSLSVNGLKSVSRS